MRNILEIAKSFTKFYPEGWFEKNIKSSGIGRSTIEVYGNFRDSGGRVNKQLLFEVSGPNGAFSCDIGHNLHQQVNDIIQCASIA